MELLPPLLVLYCLHRQAAGLPLLARGKLLWKPSLAGRWTYDTLIKITTCLKHDSARLQSLFAKNRHMPHKKR